MAHGDSEKKRKTAKTMEKRRAAAEYYEATWERDRDPAKREVHGIDAVNRILAGVAFPISRRDLMEEIRGREQFNWVKGRNMDLYLVFAG